MCGPLYRGWLRLALFAHRLVAPVVVIPFVFAIVTRSGLTLLLLPNESLGLRVDREARRSWIGRRFPGSAADPMRNRV